MLKKTIAAACVLATLGFGAPALAGGYGHGHYRGHHSYHRHDGAAVFAGGLLLGALIGSLTAPRPVYVAPPPTVYVPPQPALGNCRTIYGTGYLNGRPAVFEGTGCYDAYGNLYPVPGSERFHRYLN
ncbi:MAG: hypothetical protein OEN55_04625 [Alphaproteobacteria bacterium]|nr:hypothetical protein [Alphaproteobacteria bacterium]